MKKSVLLALSILVFAGFSGWAQIKTSFTVENRPADFMPTGFSKADSEQKNNKKDVKLPAKTRGIERYEKTNVFGQVISDDFLLYRSVLNDRQQVIYDQMYKTLMEGGDYVNFLAKISESELDEVVDAVRFDNPEIFWWSGARTWWSNSDGTATSMEFHFWVEKDQIQFYYDKFWEMTTPVIYYANLLPDEMSKIKYIHDFICLSTEYDNESYNRGEVGGILQTAYSCAVNYLTVCAGYSACFQYYMQQLGIPCVCVYGDGHQWNLLKVNGQYYQMDVTWDDTQIIPTYYNLKHEDMQSVDMHNLDSLPRRIANKYPSTSDSMSYTNYHGMLLEGSPYLYSELNYYDYSLEEQVSNIIYKEEPRIITTIDSFTDFMDLMTENLYSINEDVIYIYWATTKKNLYDTLVYSMRNERTIPERIYDIKTDAQGFSYNFNYTDCLNYQICNLRITLDY